MAPSFPAHLLRPPLAARTLFELGDRDEEREAVEL